MDNDTNQTQLHDNKLLTILKRFTSCAAILLILILLSRVYELSINQINVNIKANLFSFLWSALVADLSFFFSIAGYLLIITVLLSFISSKVSNGLLIAFCTIITVLHLLLIKYFSVVLNPLGGDAYHYSLADIKQILGAAISPGMVLAIVILIVVSVLIFKYLPRYIRPNKIVSLLLIPLCLFSMIFCGFKSSASLNFGSEYNNNLAVNKSAYFYEASLGYFFHTSQNNATALDDEKYSKGMLVNDFSYLDETNYPFLHTDSSREVLSAFMTKNNTPPNIVFIVVEGLGRAFSNENAYLKSFTPFLDSLSQHSLYWENCISTAGRTFSVLPSILASLPYGQHGFAELGDEMPAHLGLIKILADNGYRSSFIYAGDSKFDNMSLFMKRQKVDALYDMSNFNSSYKKLPSTSDGFSWGYGDTDLYRFYFEQLDKQTNDKPQISVLLTVATHSPFLINEQSKYDALFEKRMQDLKLDATAISQHREYKAQYASILYMDDALRHFFKAYASKPTFKNTIFIITGDHRMPDIPLSTKIDRYHVPLIMYSASLKHPAKFSGVVSHLDIAPSLLAYEKHAYHFKSPSLVTWIGAGLDTAHYFRNVNNYPLIPTKEGISEYLSGTHMLCGNELFVLSANMGLDPVNNDDNQRQKIQLLLNKFIERNNKMIAKKTLLPDSILNKY